MGFHSIHLRHGVNPESQEQEEQSPEEGGARNSISTREPYTTSVYPKSPEGEWIKRTQSHSSAPEAAPEGHGHELWD